jgi:hypothetical protein
MSSNYICTRKGIRFDLSSPQAELVDFQDIALALERIPRFTGHVMHSVAAHSLAVYELVIKSAYSLNMAMSDHIAADLHLAALLHDAHEAYIGDIATPVNHEIHRRARLDVLGYLATHPAAPAAANGLSILKDDVQRVIHVAAKLPWPMPYGWSDIIRAADNAAMLGERDMALRCPTRGWGEGWPTESLAIPLPNVIHIRNPAKGFLAMYHHLQHQRGHFHV